MMRELLKQSIIALPDVSDEIRGHLLNKKQKQTPLDLNEAQQLLERVLGNIAKSRTIYVCIDTLDEFEDMNRRDFLQSIRRILTSIDRQVLVFVTRRLHIENVVMQYLALDSQMPMTLHLRAN
ncbi:hypothetical protein FPQ18DRAFT_31813 [Pyronema domesticum]|nr:hypothetical protein FPQ18DRAFT_31813 [Pyronema domesticum]